MTMYVLGPGLWILPYSSFLLHKYQRTKSSPQWYQLSTNTCRCWNELLIVNVNKYLDIFSYKTEILSTFWTNIPASNHGVGALGLTAVGVCHSVLATHGLEHLWTNARPAGTASFTLHPDILTPCQAVVVVCLAVFSAYRLDDPRTGACLFDFHLSP